MNFKKTVAVVTVIFFSFTSVFSGTLRAEFNPQAGAKQALANVEDFLIPQSCGRITDGELFNSKQLVINIQDLHCNPEVQHNISNILSLLDRKFGLNKVYVEGGYGNVSTSWLCDVKDNEAKKEILEGLINQGRLTGSEYYSVVSNKPGLLRGIEDEKIHKANIVRLGQIIDKKGYFEQKLKGMEKDLDNMKKEYFNGRNRHFDALISQQKTGAIKTEKYYELLSKYVEKINANPNSFNNLATIRMEDYPQVSAYLELSRMSKELRYERISRELQGYIQQLKMKMPYSEYKLLLEKTDNFSKTDALYECLSAIEKSYGLDLKSNYSDLNSFLQYVEKSKKLNPIRMINEEKRLVEAIRIGFSEDVSELDVSFLSDYFGYFKDYLLNNLSAEDYKYFIKKLNKFESVWKKYSLNSGINQLITEFSLLNDFYETNCKRNSCFLSNMPISANLNAGTPQSITSLDQETINKTLKNSEIMVVVTGGFHTEGLKEALAKRGISYVAITPGITKDAKTSELVYTALAKEQAKEFSVSALQLALGSYKASVESITPTEIVVNINGKIITFSRKEGNKVELTGEFKSIEIAGKRFGKEAMEEAVSQALEGAETIQEFANPMAAVKLISGLVKSLACLAGKENVFGYNGVIWDIVKDPNIQAYLAKEGAVEDVLKNLPDYIQEMILREVQIYDLTKIRNPIIDAIVTNPAIKPLIYEMAYKNPRKELPELRDVVNNEEKESGSFYARHMHFMSKTDFEKVIRLIRTAIANAVQEDPCKAFKNNDIVETVINTIKAGKVEIKVDERYLIDYLQAVLEDFLFNSKKKPTIDDCIIVVLHALWNFLFPLTPLAAVNSKINWTANASIEQLKLFIANNKGGLQKAFERLSEHQKDVFRRTIKAFWIREQSLRRVFVELGVMTQSTYEPIVYLLNIDFKHLSSGQRPFYTFDEVFSFADFKDFKELLTQCDWNLSRIKDYLRVRSQRLTIAKIFEGYNLKSGGELKGLLEKRIKGYLINDPAIRLDDLSSKFGIGSGTFKAVLEEMGINLDSLRAWANRPNATVESQTEIIGNEGSDNLNSISLDTIKHKQVFEVPLKEYKQINLALLDPLKREEFRTNHPWMDDDTFNLSISLIEGCVSGALSDYKIGGGKSLVEIVIETFKAKSIIIAEDVLRDVLDEVLKQIPAEIVKSIGDSANVIAHAAWNFLFPLTPLSYDKKNKQLKKNIRDAYSVSGMAPQAFAKVHRFLQFLGEKPECVAAWAAFREPLSYCGQTIAESVGVNTSIPDHFNDVNELTTRISEMQPAIDLKVQDAIESLFEDPQYLITGAKLEPYEEKLNVIRKTLDEKGFKDFNITVSENPDLIPPIGDAYLLETFSCVKKKLMVHRAFLDVITPRNWPMLKGLVEYTIGKDKALNGNDPHFNKFLSQYSSVRTQENYNKYVVRKKDISKMELLATSKESAENYRMGVYFKAVRVVYNAFAGRNNDEGNMEAALDESLRSHGFKNIRDLKEIAIAKTIKAINEYTPGEKRALRILAERNKGGLESAEVKVLDNIEQISEDRTLRGKCFDEIMRQYLLRESDQFESLEQGELTIRIPNVMSSAEKKTMFWESIVVEIYENLSKISKSKPFQRKYLLKLMKYYSLVAPGDFKLKHGKFEVKTNKRISVYSIMNMIGDLQGFTNLQKLFDSFLENPGECRTMLFNFKKDGTLWSLDKLTSFMVPTPFSSVIGRQFANTCSVLADLLSPIFKIIPFADGEAEAVSLGLPEHTTIGSKDIKNNLLVLDYAMGGFFTIDLDIYYDRDTTSAEEKYVLKQDVLSGKLHLPIQDIPGVSYEEFCDIYREIKIKKLENTVPCFLSTLASYGLLLDEKDIPFSVCLENSQKAVEMAPLDTYCWIGVSQICLEMGNYDEAEICCKKVLRLDPNSRRAFELMGMINFKKNNYKAALKYFDKAILDLRPSNFIYFLAKGESCLYEGREKEAIECFKNAARIEQGQVRASQEGQKNLERYEMTSLNADKKKTILRKSLFEANETTTPLAYVPEGKAVSYVFVNLVSPRHAIITDPLSINALMGDLRHKYGDGVATAMVDTQYGMTAEEAVEEIKQMNPHVVGLSAQLESEKSLYAIMDLMVQDPWFLEHKVWLQVGNNLPTNDYIGILTRYKDYPYLMAVRGEGELAVRETVRLMRGEILIDDIPAASFMRDGKIVENNGILVSASELGVPARDTLEELIAHKADIMFETSRGCGWGHCTFCYKDPYRGHTWEPFPDEVVLDGLEYLQEKGVANVILSDPEFFGGGTKTEEGIERAGRLALRMKERGITRLRLNVSLRADSVYSNDKEKQAKRIETLRLMKEVGFVIAFLGIESGSNTQLKRYRKGVTKETNQKAIEILRKFQYEIVAGFITLDPFCTLDEIKENIEFLRDNNLYIEVSFPLNQLQVQAGTEYYDNALRAGLLGERQANLHMFDCWYQNQDVQEVADALNEVNKAGSVFYVLKYMFRTKALIRAGEDENEIAVLKRCYEDYNKMEIDYLEELVNNVSNPELFQKTIRSYHLKRMGMIRSIEEYIKSGKIKDENHTVMNEIEKIRPALIAAQVEEDPYNLDPILTINKSVQNYENSPGSQHAKSLDLYREAFDGGIVSQGQLEKIARISAKAKKTFRKATAVKTGVENILTIEQIKDLRKKSGLPFSLDPEEWGSDFSRLPFDSTVNTNVNIPYEMHSTRLGEDMREVLMDTDAEVPQDAYYMFRSLFLSQDDIKRCFNGMKTSYNLTVIPPGLFGEEYAKTYGHFHNPNNVPQIFQVISGEAMFMMVKLDKKGLVEDVITVKAKDGDAVIIPPGYGHVSYNISKDKPLFLADLQTWEQTSDYTYFQEHRGAPYYVTVNPDPDNADPVLNFNKFYAKELSPKFKGVRQMLPSAKVLSNLGLEAGDPVYNLVKHPKNLRFLNYPSEYEDFLTPEATLRDVAEDEKLEIQGSPETPAPGLTETEINAFWNQLFNIRDKQDLDISIKFQQYMDLFLEILRKSDPSSDFIKQIDALGGTVTFDKLLKNSALQKQFRDLSYLYKEQYPLLNIHSKLIYLLDMPEGQEIYHEILGGIEELKLPYKEGVMGFALLATKPDIEKGEHYSREYNNIGEFKYGAVNGQIKITKVGARVIGNGPSIEKDYIIFRVDSKHTIPLVYVLMPTGELQNGGYNQEFLSDEAFQALLKRLREIFHTTPPEADKLKETSKEKHGRSEGPDVGLVLKATWARLKDLVSTNIPIINLSVDPAKKNNLVVLKSLVLQAIDIADELKVHLKWGKKQIDQIMELIFANKGKKASDMIDVFIAGGFPQIEKDNDDGQFMADILQIIGLLVMAPVLEAKVLAEDLAGFVAGHSIPDEYQENPEEYLRILTNIAADIQNKVKEKAFGTQAPLGFFVQPHFDHNKEAYLRSRRLREIDNELKKLESDNLQASEQYLKLQEEKTNLLADKEALVPLVFGRGPGRAKRTLERDETFRRTHSWLHLPENWLELADKYKGFQGISIEDLAGFEVTELPSQEMYESDRHNAVFSRYNQEKEKWESGERPKPVLPGVEDFLKILKKNKALCKVISGSLSDEILLKATDLGMDGYFESLQGSPDTKPGVLEELKKAGSKPIMFGDAPADMKAAKSTRCIAAGIAMDKASEQKLIDNGADIIIKGSYAGIARIVSEDLALENSEYVEIINPELLGTKLDVDVFVFDWDGTVSDAFSFWKQVEGEDIARYVCPAGEQNPGSWEAAKNWGIEFQKRGDGITSRKKYELLIDDLRAFRDESELARCKLARQDFEMGLVPELTQLSEEVFSGDKALPDAVTEFVKKCFPDSELAAGRQEREKELIDNAENMIDSILKVLENLAETPSKIYDVVVSELKKYNLVHFETVLQEEAEREISAQGTADEPDIKNLKEQLGRAVISIQQKKEGGSLAVIDGSKLTESLADVMAQCGNIQFDIHGQAMSQKQLNMLAGMGNIVRLDVRDNRGIQKLPTSLKNNEIIIARNCSLSEILDLRSYPKLQELNVGTNFDLRKIINCPPGLKKINVQACGINLVLVSEFPEGIGYGAAFIKSETEFIAACKPIFDHIEPQNSEDGNVLVQSEKDKFKKLYQHVLKRLRQGKGILSIDEMQELLVDEHIELPRFNRLTYMKGQNVRDESTKRLYLLSSAAAFLLMMNCEIGDLSGYHAYEIAEGSLDSRWKTLSWEIIRKLPVFGRLKKVKREYPGEKGKNAHNNLEHVEKVIDAEYAYLNDRDSYFTDLVDRTIQNADDETLRYNFQKILVKIRYDLEEVFRTVPEMKEVFDIFTQVHDIGKILPYGSAHIALGWRNIDKDFFEPLAGDGYKFPGHIRKLLTFLVANHSWLSEIRLSLQPARRDKNYYILDAIGEQEAFNASLNELLNDPEIKQNLKLGRKEIMAMLVAFNVADVMSYYRAIPIEDLTAGFNTISRYARSEEEFQQTHEQLISLLTEKGRSEEQIAEDRKVINDLALRLGAVFDYNPADALIQQKISGPAESGDEKAFNKALKEIEKIDKTVPTLTEFYGFKKAVEDGKTALVRKKEKAVNAASALESSLDVFEDYDPAEIMSQFSSQMANRTVGGGKSSLAMVPSYVKFSEGEEEGEYLSADWGGTNLRVDLIKLKKGHEPQIVKSIRMPFTDQHKSGIINPFEAIVEQIASLGLDPEKEYGLGFTFAFGIDQTSASSGKLIKWSKGWSVPGVEGEDVAQLLQQALDGKGWGNIKVKALVNDVVAIHLTVPNADVGLGFGTGFNLSSLDDNGQIINIEAGGFNFDGMIRSVFDSELYKNTDPLNEHAFEKMISGAYIGQLVRMCLQEMRKNGKFMETAREVPFLDEPQKLRPEEFEKEDGVWELISAVRADTKEKLGIDIPEFSDVNEALNWINETPVFFKLFDKSREKYLTEANWKLYSRVKEKLKLSSLADISDKQMHALAKTPEGQKLQRIILTLLYAEKMPQDNPDIFMTKLLSLAETHGTVNELRGALLKDRRFEMIGRLSEDKDLAALKEISETVSRRAGRMLAAQILAIISHKDPSVSNSHLVAVSGSMYDKHPKMPEYIYEGLDEICAEKNIKRPNIIMFTFVENGSEIGAAVAAAVVSSESQGLYELFPYNVFSFEFLKRVYQYVPEPDAKSMEGYFNQPSIAIVSSKYIKVRKDIVANFIEQTGAASFVDESGYSKDLITLEHSEYKEILHELKAELKQKNEDLLSAGAPDIKKKFKKDIKELNKKIYSTAREVAELEKREVHDKDFIKHHFDDSTPKKIFNYEDDGSWKLIEELTDWEFVQKYGRKVLAEMEANWRKILKRETQWRRAAFGVVFAGLFLILSAASFIFLNTWLTAWVVSAWGLVTIVPSILGLSLIAKKKAEDIANVRTHTTIDVKSENELALPNKSKNLKLVKSETSTLADKLKEISERKLFAVEIKADSIKNKNSLNEIVGMIADLLERGKKVVIYSGEGGPNYTRALSEAIRKYVGNKQKYFKTRNFDFSLFQGLQVYAEAGKKYSFDKVSRVFKEDLSSEVSAQTTVFNVFDALFDAQNSYGLGSNEAAAVADFSSLKEEDLNNIDKNIRLMNTSSPACGGEEIVLQLSDNYGDIGSLFWLELLHELINFHVQNDNKAEFIQNVINVIEILLEHPDETSKDIAASLGIGRKDLLKIYKFIQAHDGLRLALIKNSKFPDYTRNLPEMFDDAERMDRIMRGAVVYPKILEMHLGTYCNSHCIMCFSQRTEYEQEEANKKQTQLDGEIAELRASPGNDEQIKALEAEKEKILPKREPLTFEEIKAIISDAKRNGVEEIWFSGGKEPLAAGEKLFDAIKFANELGFKTRLYTNGELMSTNPEKLKILLGCSQVRFSINAATPETYDKIHYPKPVEENSLFYSMYNRSGNEVYERVKRNVNAFIKLRDEMMNDASVTQKPKVKIAVSQVVQPLNYQELTDFIDMAYEMGVDSVQIRAESSGMVREFTEDEKEDIISQANGIESRRSLGEFEKMEIDLRGVTRKELDADKAIEQFLPGMKKSVLCRAGAMKRGIDPFGFVYNCEFSMHPENAVNPGYRNIGVKIGDVRAEGGFHKVMEQMAGIFLPNTCPMCQAHEYGMNVALQKFACDFAYGIAIKQQPYFNPQSHPEKVALIGAGRLAQFQVIPTLLDVLPKKSKIVAIARSNYKEVKEKYSNQEEIEVVDSEMTDEVLNDPEIKSVIITASFDSHYELVKKALMAGKNVFVEKPFTRTSAEAEELVKIAEDRKLILSVGYEYMLEKDFLKLKDIAGGNYLGKIESIELKMLNPVAGRKLDYSSSVIEDLGVHQLSILVSLFGTQKVSDLRCKFKVESADITFNYGAVKVRISVNRDYKGEKIRTVKLSGEKGGIILDYGAPDRKVTFSAEGVELPEDLKETGGEKFMASEYKLFFDAVRTKKEPKNSAAATNFIVKLTEELSKIDEEQKASNKRIVAAKAYSPAKGPASSYVDWDVVSAEEAKNLTQIAKKAGAVTMDEYGRIHTHIYLFDRLPKTAFDKLNPKTTKMIVDEKQVWLGIINGIPALFAEDESAFSIEQMITERISPKGGAKPSMKTVRALNRSLKQAGVNANFEKFEPGITINWTEKGRTITYNELGTMTVSGDHFDGIDPEDRAAMAAKISSLMAIRARDKNMMAQNLYFSLDTVEDFEGFKRNLKAAATIGNGQWIVDPDKAFKGLKDSEKKAIAKLARKCGLEMFMDLGKAAADQALKEKEALYKRLGFTGYALPAAEAGKMKICTYGLPESEAVTAEIITKYDSPQELINKINEPGTDSKVMLVSGIMGLMENDRLDIGDYPEMFKMRILSLFNANRLTAESVSEAGLGWEKLPTYQFDSFEDMYQKLGAIVGALNRGETNNLLDLIGEDSVKMYAERIDKTAAKGDADAIKRAYLRAVVKTVLAKAKVDYVAATTKDETRREALKNGLEGPLRKLLGELMLNQIEKNLPRGEFNDIDYLRSLVQKPGVLTDEDFNNELYAAAKRLGESENSQDIRVAIELIAQLGAAKEKVNIDKELEMFNARSVAEVVAAA